MTTLTQATSNEIDELMNSDAYAEFIMQQDDLLICNGHMLLAATESLVMFDEFLASLNLYE